MNTMTLDSWCKPEGATKSSPLGLIRFRISDADHIRMEEAEEQLKHSDKSDAILDVDLSNLELETPPQCGKLSDCQLRVYIHKDDQRGHFHLVGHRASDGSLVYTNAVMVDLLG
ncbi:hypothetical protein BTA51_16750 [Hahella sp. CCB-MM4]|uniref:hypothetical protein n=1 Tax=Hahella sp. (strain CCB-MM4) TaxID=1926491 RepID=UPI000B9C39B5|nr:hypothetical protein [Hahella sp. CCB-MM4]OZG72377.1 hypothetical protein BTA51_16750 [Hahella sp. CCB-MM4]